MRFSTVLSFRAWSKKIHAPLPLNPRESQQLLNILTASFQRHLDEQHPTVHNDHSQRAGVSERNDSVGPVKQLPSPAHESARTAADRHIASVLSNPLLSSAAFPTNLPHSRPALPAVPIDLLRKQLDKGPPIEQFKKCLNAIWRRGCDLDVAATSTVQLLDWMLDHKKADIATLISPFRTGYGTGHRLFKSIIFCERHELVDSWLNEKSKLDDRSRRNILYFYLHKNTQTTKDVKHLQRALQLMSLEFQRRTLHKDSQEIVLAVVLDRMLSDPEVVQELPLVCYNHFIDAVTQDVMVAGPHIKPVLELLHPQHPNATAALQYLKSGAMELKLATTSFKRFRRYCVRLCLALARQLLADKNTADADFVLGFARSKFPVELGFQQFAKEDRTLQEDSNIQRLHDLELGALT